MKLSIDGNNQVSLVGKFTESHKIQKAIAELSEHIGSETPIFCHTDNEDDNESDYGFEYDGQFNTIESVKKAWKFVKKGL